MFGGRLEEEVERIVDGHFGHQVHLDAELVDLLGEREARDVVALRILLPVQKVAGWRDALRIGQDRRAAVRRRTQANELRRQLDRPVVPVLRHVAKRDVDAQGIFQLYHFGYEDLPLRPLRTSAFLRKHRMCQLRPPRRLPAGPAAGRLAGPRWRRHVALSPAAGGRGGYRLCQNYKIEGICNWAVPADDDNPLCVSCRITRVIPNLADPAHRAAWYRLEVAKRRLLFTLIELGLPMANRIDDPERGLTFEFLADADPGGAPVLTGHADGVITVNIAEADDAERERRRTAMHEPYRTLLGHMRHESGHYYWDRLIAGTPELDEFRSLFGDERADYAASLSAHYEQRRPGRLAGAVRQRLRELAPVGGLGRNVGALSAHGRHARDRRRVRSLAEAAAPRRAGAAGDAAARCRRSRPRSSV